MDAEERAENLERQAEEAEALSSIYGDDFTSGDGVWTVRIPLLDPDSDTSEAVIPPWILSADGTPPPEFLTLRCIPLETYPSRTSFLAEVGPCDVIPFHADAVTAAQEMYDETPGEVCVFAFVERVRQMCDAWQEDACDVPGDDAASDNQKNENSAQEVFDPVALAAELAAIAVTTGSDERQTGDTSETTSRNDFTRRIHHGVPFVERKSTFQAHLLTDLKGPEEASKFFNHLVQSDSKIDRASHNMLAYRCAVGNNHHSDHDDDGEHGAGKGLAHLLKVTDSENVCVVVSRWFGGIHLGPDRFKCINNAARDLLIECTVAKLKNKSSTKAKK